MSSTSAGAPVKLSLPLEYQQAIFQELRANDELVVLARGLGLLRLVTNLLHTYDAAGSSLVLVVNATERENGWIGEALAEHAAVSGAAAAGRARGLTLVNTEFSTVGAREKRYRQGGIFSITSRILVVDLLTGLMDAASITGVVVLHAERVVATSLEAFILRIYRQKNRAGFLKAFCDSPETLTTRGGFAPLATTMRNLFLRRASLWPRFHMTVAASLEGTSLSGAGYPRKAEVIELEVPMTDAMKTIQAAILECVEVSIHELKKANAGLFDSAEDWSVDSALLRDFDVAVRRQLEPNWHRLSWKTKQTVADLTVLRGMLHSIVACDAVAFLQLLDTIHAAHLPAPGSTRQTESPWLFLDAAETIFATARQRVYAGSQSLLANNSSNSNPAALRPVLEEQPKWAVLAEILAEIDRDLYQSSAAASAGNNTILIMCGDTDTCRQLRDFLQTMHVRPRSTDAPRVEEFFDPEQDRPSGAFMMRRKLRNYLKWKREFAQVNAALFAENQRALSGAVDPRTRRSGAAPANKRRRMRGGGGGIGGMAAATAASAMAAASVRAANGSIMPQWERPGDVAELMADMEAEARSDKANDNGSGFGSASASASAAAAAALKAEILASLDDPMDHMDDYYQLYDMDDLVVVHAYDGDQDEHVLDEVRPRYIIMYEPDAAFVRRIEVYRSSSSHRTAHVRTYFMYYSGSVEEQRYLAAVRREKDAFTRLIKERASMSLVLGGAVDLALGGPGSAPGPGQAGADPEEAFLRTVNTRIAGGGRLEKAATAQPPRVVVDVREFRSSLPSLLHGRSMVVVPCMLTVGDYVLSPNICVERKSVSDLISSFRDGRLFAQCESMFQHYRDAMLLIEFDQNKSFTLEPFADYASGGGISYGSVSAAAANNASPQATDLQAKLVLLTLAFPRLRILWASSPYETAEIFERLKAQEPEPDPVAAVQAGLDPSNAAAVSDSQQQPFLNPEPQEMMRAVPGVTPQNLQTLVLETDSIQAVAQMDAAALTPLVGAAAARQIEGFFKRDIIEEAG